MEMDFDRRDARAEQLRVMLTDSSLREVFNPLASDIAAWPCPAEPACEAVLAAVRRFEHWRQMLQSLVDSGLSAQSKARTVRRADPFSAITSWRPCPPLRPSARGPDQPERIRISSFHAPRSRSRPARARSRRTLAISSERELDDTGTGRLDPRALLTGRTARRQRREPERDHRPYPGPIAGTAAAELLDSLLVRAGYLTEQRDLYDEPRYTVRKKRFWHVTGDFPRITEADLRPGVGDCEYRISIAGLEQYAMPAEEVLSAVMEGSPR